MCSGRASHDLGVCVEFLFQKKAPSNLDVSAISAAFLCHSNHLVCFDWQFNHFFMLWLLWLKIRNDLLCHDALWRDITTLLPRGDPKNVTYIFGIVKMQVLEILH